MCRVMVPGQKSGTRVKNPAIQVVSDTAGVIRAFGSEFGLTPYTRMQLGLPVQEVEDIDAGFERWQAERRQEREPHARTSGGGSSATKSRGRRLSGLR